MAVGNLIGGMYLNGQILAGINKFDEQRELITETTVVFFTDEMSFQFSHQLVEALALVLAVADNRFMVFHTGDFPAFASPECFL